MNYGKPGNVEMGSGILSAFHPPFEFKEISEKTHGYVLITDPKKIDEIGHAISPIYHVDKADPPVLLLHGDADTLVPIQQSQTLAEKLTSVGVEVKLITRKGMGHGWPRLNEDVNEVGDFFDRHLLKKPATSTSPATMRAAPGG
jgi:acetyl esterase/lipase